MAFAKAPRRRELGLLEDWLAGSGEVCVPGAE